MEQRQEPNEEAAITAVVEKMAETAKGWTREEFAARAVGLLIRDEGNLNKYQRTIELVLRVHETCIAARATADRGGEPTEAEVEAAIVAEADAINKTHGDPGHDVHWPDDFTPDEQHCRREGMRAALTASARIRSALATTAGEGLRAALESIRDLEPGTQEWVDGKVTTEQAAEIGIKAVAIARAALVTDKG